MGHFGPCKQDYSAEQPSHREKNRPDCLTCLHTLQTSQRLNPTETISRVLGVKLALTSKISFKIKINQ